MLARVPWTSPIKAEKPKPKRLTKDRKRAIREKVITIMRTVEPTPFAAEGPCRAGIRSSLCGQGWKWADADAVANEIVTAALNIVGAKRPTWMQGQPEWTQPGALPILRERCARCNKPLPEGHRLWCSDVCAHAAKMDRQRQRWDEEAYAKWQVNKAAWKERQPERECHGCGREFKPNRENQRYCRYECSNIV